jgi:hypothetical protein
MANIKRPTATPIVAIGPGVNNFLLLSDVGIATSLAHLPPNAQ